MLTAAEFTERMERMGQLVDGLSQQSDSPASLAAAELVRTLSDLHAAGLQRMLALIQSSGPEGRPLLEKFAQDDLIRSLLLLHDLHPIDLRTRVTEAIDNLRPVVESYGGRVSITSVQPRSVVVWLDVSADHGPSPVEMLQKLLQHAILVVAPDVAEVRFEDGPAAARLMLSLPIITRT